jgi:putative hemolysin
MSRLARPAVSVLSLSSDAVLRLLRVRPVTEPPVTEEEIRLLIERGTLTGAVEPAEREMMERIFRLGDRTVTTIMTPHPDVVWLDLDEPREERLRRISTSGHSHFPVVREKRDNVLGVLHVRDLLAQCLAGRVVDPEAVVQPALFVPETAVASELLERFREAGTHVALVIDEYGSLQGMVTTNDILEAIVGEMPEPREGGGPSVVQREDGSWLVDGALPAEDLVAACGIRELPGGEERRYETVGGLMMTHLGRIPRAGDHFLWSGFRFEVVDMDGRRVDKVLIQPPPPPPNASQAGAGGHP